MLFRTAKVCLTDEFRNAVESRKVKDAEINRAVGYLTSWAMGSDRYASVVIVGDQSGNLDSQYKDKDGNPTYSLFGLLNDGGTYSFHS